MSLYVGLLVIGVVLSLLLFVADLINKSDQS